MFLKNVVPTYPSYKKIYRNISSQIYGSESRVPNLPLENARKAVVAFYAKEVVQYRVTYCP